ncbi:hypothetical protein [Bradyrhizobium sp. BR 1433]|uniref:hypothetical protein n=1 Tax=Bradyrhizobium sp. BR 1433 TaxID=3447967 RepID=UPI003EE5FE78
MRNQPIVVQKYGGACLETPAKIRAVARSLADLHGSAKGTSDREKCALFLHPSK